MSLLHLPLHIVITAWIIARLEKMGSTEVAKVLSADAMFIWWWDSISQLRKATHRPEGWLAKMLKTTIIDPYLEHTIQSIRQLEGIHVALIGFVPKKE